MPNIIKSFRLFEVLSNGQILPVLYWKPLNFRNTFETEEEAIAALSNIDDGNPANYYCILPVYNVID